MTARTLRIHRLKIAWMALLLVMVLAHVASKSSSCPMHEDGEVRCPSELVTWSPFLVVVPATVPRLAPIAVEAERVNAPKPVHLAIAPPTPAPVLAFAPKTSPPA